MTNPEQSILLEYLPDIYREDPFIGRFLLAFEKILLVNDDKQFPNFPFQGKGIEEQIDWLSDCFDPEKTPASFLSWLADWTAFPVRYDLTEKKKRDFIKKIIQRYLWRGTKKNLEELLKTFSGGEPTVDEATSAGLQIGDRSTIGEDIYLGGGLPHFFRVTINLAKGTAEILEREFEIIHALIELEKPAHTFYELIINHPTMQIGDTSRVGFDTILGTAHSGDPVNYGGYHVRY